MFPIVADIPEELLKSINPDNNFASEISAEYDLSWQFLQKGYIGEADTYTSFQKLPLVDEYRFLRKYFHPVWSVYVFLLRLLTHNPMQEWKAWRDSRNVRRSKYLEDPVYYSGWKGFESTLHKESPVVSVIIPTLNRYKYLKDVLRDLEQQDYYKFEVIIVDQSKPFQEKFYQQFNLNLNVTRQEEKALWLARNNAIKKSRGEFILLFDDDSRVESDWISNHLKCLDFFNADISSGVSISKLGSEVPQNYSFFRISDQIDTGNVLIKKNIFREIGLFDRQFEKQRMGDAEFGLRCFFYGFKNISNPYAGRLHLKVGEGGLREMGSWDAFRPNKLFAPRPIPSVLYYFRKYFGKKRCLLAVIKSVPPSIIPYRFKKNKKMMLLGAFISLILFPLVVIQVLISWKLAERKLIQGARISELK